MSIFEMLMHALRNGAGRDEIREKEMDRLLQYLCLLSDAELEAFHLYLQMAPVRASAAIWKLQQNFRDLALDYLLPGILEKSIDIHNYEDEPEPLRQACWQRIFPDKPYNAKQLSAGFTALHRTLAEFLAIRQMEAELPEGAEKLHMIRALNGRKPATLWRKMMSGKPGFFEGAFLTEAQIAYNYQLALEFHNGNLHQLRHLKAAQMHREVEILVEAREWQQLLDLLRTLRWRVAFFNKFRERKKIAPITHPLTDGGLEAGKKNPIGEALG
ncbi:MAG: hypothetical protein AAF570_13215, partial [Bacteroidota bacterium]